MCCVFYVFIRKLDATGGVPVLLAAGFQDINSAGESYLELIRFEKLVLYILHSVLEAGLTALQSGATTTAV
jgi:hypothetical protein